MKRAKFLFGFLAALFIFSGVATVSWAADFKIGIMQDQAGEAQKYKPLLDYLKKKGVDASFVTAKDYPSAANMFANGEVDAMFSGSGVAGIMLIKELADPAVRPVGKDGHSTYWAVMVAKKDAPKYTGAADYFGDKKVIFTSLASSGEVYFKSLLTFSPTSKKITTVKAASHGAAIDAVDRGQADIAIVKNRVWDKSKSKYPNLQVVGEDKGENPDNTLIVSKKANPEIASKVASALLAVKDDASAEAGAVKNSLDIQGYIKTTPKDFEHPILLLKNAGVTKAFNFAF